MTKIVKGTKIDILRLDSIHGASITIPDREKLTHLQFRRFSGCPMCNLHIQSFIKSHHKLLANSIQEIVVFHSTKAAMLSHHADAPFPLIADPEKILYKKFGVERSLMSVLNPKAWPAGLKGLFARGTGLPGLGESLTGLPADFLINNSGTVIALKYGTHAYDHWELDEVIKLAKNE